MKNFEQHSRSAARMAVVQALYQMEAADTGVEHIIRDFTEYWMVRPSGDEDRAMMPPDLHHADRDFFALLARGVVAAQDRIDPCLEAHLATGWTLNRLDATARAILRAGLFEIMDRPETPTKVILDEYINIAHAFFAGEEPGFINGVLDAGAKEARGHELKL